MIYRHFTFLMVVGLCFVIFSVLCTAQDTESRGSENDESQPGGASEASDKATETSGTTETDEEKSRRIFTNKRQLVRVKFPQKGWLTKTPQDVSDDGPGLGCGAPRRGDSVFIVGIQSKNSKTGCALSRIKRKYVLKNREDLENYLDKRLEKMKERRGEEMELRTSSLDWEGNHLVHRLEFSAPHQARRGPGGCGMGAEPDPQKARFLLVEHFLRREGERKNRVYRFTALGKEENFSEFRKDITEFIDSFAFTGKLADEFFPSRVKESKLPDIEQGRKGQHMKWLFTGIAVAAVIYFMWFKNRGKGSGQGQYAGTGNDGDSGSGNSGDRG